MKIGDFNKIYKFMGEDTFVYLVPLRTISIRECSSLSKEIASAIKSASLPHIYININIQGKAIDCPCKTFPLMINAPIQYWLNIKTF